MRWMAAVALFLFVSHASAEIKCPPGFDFVPNSGVGCVQKDCFAKGGKWSSTQKCICHSGQKICKEQIKGFDMKNCEAFCPPYNLLSCIEPGSLCPNEKLKTSTTVKQETTQTTDTTLKDEGVVDKVKTK